MEFISIVRLFLGTYALFPLNFLFWLVILLIGFQYRRLARNEEQLLGRAKYPVNQQTLYSAIFGLAGGLLASSLLVFFGISLVEIGIYFVWPLAILLLLVHPRYMCFAYAGGIVGAIAAILRILGNTWPLLTQGILGELAGIHIPGLLALIGILHLTESFLIAVSGHLFTSPIYVKTEKGVVGGYSLQKFWPLPLVGLVAEVVSRTSAEAVAGVPMPDWWPLLASTNQPGPDQTLMYMLIPIVAGLGYGDLAVSTRPKEKSKQSALNLALYSLTLIGVAFIAYYYPLLTIPAALFSPFGHELLIMLGNKREFAGEPLFAAPYRGVKVLDTFPNSPAVAAKLVPGDIILSVNSYPVNSTLDFQSAIRMAGLVLELELEGKGSRPLKAGPGAQTGIILAPDRYVPMYMEIKHKHFFSALAEKLQKFKA